MKTKRVIIDDAMMLSNDIEESLTQLHKEAMSDDPMRACQARINKLIANAVDQWLDDEAERNTEGDIVLTAAMAGGLVLFFSVLASMTNNPKAMKKMAECMRQPLATHYQLYVSKIDEMLEAPADAGG
jgi:hypothetical protein